MGHVIFLCGTNEKERLWRLLTVREGRFSPKSGEWAAWVRQIPPAEETPAEESAKHENMSSRDDLPVASRIDHGSLQYPQVQKGSEVMVIVQVSMSGYDSSTVRDACVRAASALRKAADRASPDPFPLTQMLLQYMKVSQMLRILILSS